MSTSDPDLASLARSLGDQAGGTGTVTTVPSGIPDTAALARIANEFFRFTPAAVPLAESAIALEQPKGELTTLLLENSPLGLPSDLPSQAPPKTPSETELRSVSVSPPPARAQAPAVPGSAVPVIPDGIAESRFGGSSGLSFLQEIRPLYPEAEFSTPLTQTPTEQPQRFASSDWPGSAVPGGVSESRFGGGSGQSFLDEIRPLAYFQTGLETPSGHAVSDPSLPADVDLSLLNGQLADSPPSQSGQPLDTLRTPQLPGVGLPLTAGETAAAFGFLHEARPLVPGSSGAAPQLADVVSQSELPLNITSTEFDVQAVRRDFPILQERVHGKPLIWLDNAATTQKPQSVIDRLSYFYQHENSNIHRAAHELAARATDAYEAAREKVRRFINSPSAQQVIFVRGTTEGINLVAQSWGRQNIQKDDEIVITWLEHHANIVPWQMLCSQTGARLRVAPVDDTGQVLLDDYQRLLGPKTRLVSFTQVSNALGTVTPAVEMIEMAHRYGAKVLLDGAQAVSHIKTDVQAFDCDFYIFSGHKMFAPTGIGVVYGKTQELENAPPWQGGGNMIQDVTFERTTYQPPPAKFEAGTGNIADAVGLGAAIDYLERVGLPNISRYEHDLLLYATEQLQRIPGLRLIGTARERAGVLSFVLDGFRTEDVGAALNRQGIAVRSGHHCAQPILRRFGVESTVRPSLALYNTCEEIDVLTDALWNLKLGHSSI